jgi:hypothetical protein
MSDTSYQAGRGFRAMEDPDTGYGAFSGLVGNAKKAGAAVGGAIGTAVTAAVTGGASLAVAPQQMEGALASVDGGEAAGGEAAGAGAAAGLGEVGPAAAETLPMIL